MASMDVTFTNVPIIWTNFSGKVDEFNPAIGTDSFGNKIGKRYFNIELDDDMVEELSNIELTTKSGKVVKGANIKTRVPKNGDGEVKHTLKVLFGLYPPEEMWRVVPDGKMRLSLDTVGNLDREIIEKGKVMVTFSAYDRTGNVGITAYCKKLRVWVKEDGFDDDEDFRNLPEIGGGVSNTAPDGPVDEEDIPF